MSRPEWKSSPPVIGSTRCPIVDDSHPCAGQIDGVAAASALRRSTLRLHDVQARFEAFEQRAQQAERIFGRAERRQAFACAVRGRPRCCRPSRAPSRARAASPSSWRGSDRARSARRDPGWPTAREAICVESSRSRSGSWRSRLRAPDGWHAGRRRRSWPSRPRRYRSARAGRGRHRTEISTGRSDSVARRTTPELRSATIIV